MKSLPPNPTNIRFQYGHLLSKAVDPKNIDRIHKGRVVIHITRQIHAIPRNHLRRAHRVQVVDVDIIRVPVSLNTEDARLAPRSSTDVRALGAVVVEEAVKTYAVAEDVVRAKDTETPAVGGVT